MPRIRPRTAWMTGVLTTAVAAGLLTAVPAQAVVGDPADGQLYAFTAKLNIGDGKRSCTGALVEQQWVLTAASCFADDPAQGHSIAGGAPKLKTTATVGRPNLAKPTGSVVKVVELVPREDRDLVMAKLEKPVMGVTPVNVSSAAPAKGEELRVTGYGRTKDEWVPGLLHTARFTVDTVNATTLGLSGRAPGAAICKGDTGGPAFRERGGRFELVGVNSRSMQGGCFGNEDETRTDAVDSRVDDVANWVDLVSARTLLPRKNWGDAVHLASGYFTSDPADGKRRMDLFVAWKDGSASLFRGADHDDPKYPFSAEYQLEGPGSYWTRARAVTAGRYTDSGRDGLTVRWSTGKLSTYTHVDEFGFHDEKTLASSDSWKNARLITSGRFTDNPLRDDLLVLWEDGSTSMYIDTGVNGVRKESQLTWADKGWKNAAQISAGEFTGKKTADLMIRWKDGQTQVFPGVDPSGYHNGRVGITKIGSHWKNASQITVGSFTKPNGRLNDIMVRWNTTDLSYHPGIDNKGTHGEVQLVG
ncbi:hypothetical protein SSP35_01_03600 [Streptomyces sp. NBRC 110611]|uniref:S1 family peptidase n=1 Tax=Streptomyces sp. NBRC 110611 TaxID=1621259 RepID=UPI0008558B62|nr:S1 family peptidase [Streptomyces sp. NBRC 110611]GAU65023.1 hypothetical protein SSP35_01_03600 [Streptomyces sp. NBRC 110611]